MAKSNRDEFSQPTKDRLADLAGRLCSYPPCRIPTVGATSDGKGLIKTGVAAHICAAAPGGYRYDVNMSSVERSSIENGIWMCQVHGKAIDSSDPEFTVEKLRKWKRQAEIESWCRVMGNQMPQQVLVVADTEFIARVRAAAEADLAVFRKTTKWPSTQVTLMLDVEGFNEPVSTDELAVAVTSLDDLILVAAPGMGKTTALFQIAESLLVNRLGLPLVVPMGDWATENATILDSILRRPALSGISEDDFRKAASQPGVVLLLDGWNELDTDARTRARVQVARLKAELPELGLVISTRRQALDVPFEGARVDLLPLNEDQQMQIAIAMRGDAGAKIVDQAWRTAGLRELMTIPLYLTALLLLPKNAPFPGTKEEVLRHFVSAHEKDANRAEVLHASVQGFQQDYLEGLAVFASGAANTAISDSNARRSISETETLLIDNGQITIRTQPDAVLNVLVSSHVLTRMGETPGYSFQHQQFQEWYASLSVERRIMEALNDPKACRALKSEVFNLPAWEESILFAIERLARGDADQRAACGKAIIAAFDVDPMLAAEMIFRSTNEVWAHVSANIQDLVRRWHASGKVDRAVRFMLTSGRPEFIDLVWPLITDENEQVSLKALRNCRRFRTSILGVDAEKRIRSLPLKAREVLLHEIASHSGIDGLDLAAAIAMSDPDPEIQVTVTDAFAFRRADRHIAEVLCEASDKTFDLVVAKDLVRESRDEKVNKKLAEAQGRQKVDGGDAADRLRMIVYAQGTEDFSAELSDIISNMDIEERQDARTHLIYEAQRRYPRAVADGLIARVRAGRILFHGADDILALAGFALEDHALVQQVLANPAKHDDFAEAAASVLGPIAVGRLVDALLEVSAHLRVDGRYDEATGKLYQVLETRIAHVLGVSLVAAIQVRSAQADNDQIEQFAELLSRHPDGKMDRGRPFDADSILAIQGLVDDWGNRLLASKNAKRRQKAVIATLASRAPSPKLLPLLKRLLDDNLQLYRSFRKEAEAGGWRQGDALDEARMPMTHEYQRTFMAIKVPETAEIMCGYLADEHFGVLAAQVLADQWRTANDPPIEKRFLGSVDFSGVKELREAHAIDPNKTSAEAEVIFAAIGPLAEEGAIDKQRNLAVELGVVGLQLPHGQRRDTINRLIALANRRIRARLLLSLVISGEEINAELVVNGIAETLEAAKTETWILTQGEGYELKDWLRLLPFVSRPAKALAVVRGMPPAQREPLFLEEMVGAFADSPSDQAEDVLFKLAEEDARFYENYRWRESVLRLGTESSARRIFDLAARGSFKNGSVDSWHIARELGGLLDDHPDLRAYVHSLLKGGPTSPAFMTLVGSIAENPDEEGLLLLVKFEKDLNRSLIGLRTIEGVVTEHVPSEEWKGAYNVVPVPANSLRAKLFDMTTDRGSADIAALRLHQIDEIRDEHGIPETEPRHPDLASGKPWPILHPTRTQ